MSFFRPIPGGKYAIGALQDLRNISAFFWTSSASDCPLEFAKAKWCGNEKAKTQCFYCSIASCWGSWARADGQNPRHKADGMVMPPSLLRGMLTIALEQMVRTLGIKPTPCQCPRVYLGGFLPERDHSWIRPHRGLPCQQTPHQWLSIASTP